MLTLEKDIMTVTRGVIVHQTNCVLKAAQCTGIAETIFGTYSVAAREYDRVISENPRIFGTTQLVWVSPTIYVANLFGQFYPRAKKKEKTYGTYMPAVYSALGNLRAQVNQLNADQGVTHEVYFPYEIGCRRGGGNWAEYQEALEMLFSDATLCKLPKTDRE